MYSAPFASPSSTAATVSLLSSKQSSLFGGRSQQPLFVSAGKVKCSPLSLLAVEAKAATKRENRIARHQRIRKKVEGTPERPRLSVFRSCKHIYVQVIDDSKMQTLASASTMQKNVAEESKYTAGPTIEVAKKIGEVIAKSCVEKGITKVAFDRGGYPYHGRIKALADAARENGLQF